MNHQMFRFPPRPRLESEIVTAQFCNVQQAAASQHVPLTRSPVNLRCRSMTPCCSRWRLPSCLIKMQRANERRVWVEGGWVGVHIYAHLFIATEQGVPRGLLAEMLQFGLANSASHLGLIVSENRLQVLLSVMLLCKRFPPLPPTILPTVLIRCTNE